MVKFSSNLVFDLSVILVALYHFSFGFCYNFLKYLFELNLFIFFLICYGIWGWIWRFSSWLIYFFEGFVGIEEVEEIREFINVYAFEESIVIILKLFFTFLNECLVSTSEKFPRREHGQLVFVFTLLAANMKISHVTKSFFEGPVFLLFWEKNLNRRVITSIVYQTVPLSLWAWVNLMRYFGYLIIR